MQDLIYVRDIVPIDSLVHLGKLVIAADMIDESLDMIVLELDIIEDCPVGAQRSKDPISAERSHAVAVDRQGVHEREDVSLNASFRLVMELDDPAGEIATHLGVTTFFIYNQDIGRGVSHIETLVRSVSRRSDKSVGERLTF